MKIAITGASGFLGSALSEHLIGQGNTVIPLSRPWNVPEESDCVIHLAGENLAAKRWTEKQKQKIFTSRVEGTRRLVDQMRNLSKPPKIFLCASAVGFYGNRGDEIVDEESLGGSGFLAELCHAWEQEARRAEETGMRVVNLRFGVVLGKGGGALKKMLLPFKFGFGGVLGSGEQYMSWITLDDLLSAVDFALHKGTISGPLNLVAPAPVTNREFTKTLGARLHRPTFAAVPATALRLLVGEMADETLLSSCRALPTKLTKNGFTFTHPNIEGALTAIIG